MHIITSALTSSRNLTYHMAYDNSTCLYHHIIFGIYYYFLDIRPYFISVVTATLVLTLYLPISDIMVPCIFSPMTISAYDYLFPVYFSFAFVLDLTSSIFTIVVFPHHLHVVFLEVYLVYRPVGSEKML